MRLRIRGRRATALTALLTLALAAPVAAQADGSGSAPRAAAAAADASADTSADESVRQYEIAGPATPAERSSIATTGVSIDEVDARSVVVTADAAQARELRSRGYDLTPLAAPQARTEGRAAKPFDFPSADAKYHNYAEANT
ncbi:zinc carboxypeptidase, partial [Streptomyces sp. MCAF7]